jgi:hypothetical protein
MRRGSDAVITAGASAGSKQGAIARRVMREDVFPNEIAYGGNAAS